jgi:hypothetical protein
MDLQRRFAPLAVFASLALLVAACGGSAVVAPSAAAPPAMASEVPSIEPSPAPSPSPTGGIGEFPVVVTNVAPPSSKPVENIATMLPDTFGDMKLSVSVSPGTSLLGSPDFLGFVGVPTALGLTGADVSVAIAVSPQDKPYVFFFAIRFAGVASDRLIATVRSVAHHDGLLVTSVRLGAKTVLKMKNPITGKFAYFYARNDVLVGVTAPNDAAAAPALAAIR